MIGCEVKESGLPRVANGNRDQSEVLLQQFSSHNPPSAGIRWCGDFRRPETLRMVGGRMAMHICRNRVKVNVLLKAPRESPFLKATAEAAYHDDG